MADLRIRPAYSKWPDYNRVLRDVVVGLSAEQLAIQPAPNRWPLWATVGHLACQRISWLCGFADEPGGDATPFPDALWSCPGDEDLETVLGPAELGEALDSTFRVVEGVLDRWTLDTLDQEIRRTFGDDVWAHTRGSVIQRVFAHDVWHAAEINEVLGIAGLSRIDFWD